MVLKEAIPEKKKLEAQRRQGSTRVTQQVSTRCRPEPWYRNGEAGEAWERRVASVEELQSEEEPLYPPRRS